MKIRTGRRNGHTLYLQAGNDPGDGDVPLGFCLTPFAATELARVANAGIEALAGTDHASRPHDYGLALFAMHTGPYATPQATGELP